MFYSHGGERFRLMVCCFTVRLQFEVLRTANNLQSAPQNENMPFSVINNFQHLKLQKHPNMPQHL
jgi:hypothetical protein